MTPERSTDRGTNLWRVTFGEITCEVRVGPSAVTPRIRQAWAVQLLADGSRVPVLDTAGNLVWGLFFSDGDAFNSILMKLSAVFAVPGRSVA